MAWTQWGFLMVAHKVDDSIVFMIVAVRQINSGCLVNRCALGLSLV